MRNLFLQLANYTLYIEKEQVKEHILEKRYFKNYLYIQVLDKLYKTISQINVRPMMNFKNKSVETSSRKKG